MKQARKSDELNITRTAMRYFQLFLFIWLAACSNSKHSGENSDGRTKEIYSAVSDETEDESEYSDGTWCAEVEYFNPNTGTRSSYDLDVDVEGGELVQIHWPNGGWLDESHFSSEDITAGECSFISDRGYHYTVTLNEKGGCGSADTYRMQNDMEEEREAVTCPKCGEEKESYDDVCDDCQRKAETCPKCYGYKMKWDRICNSCQEELENQRQPMDDEDDF